MKEILKRSPTVEATAVFDHLCRQQAGAFQQGQLRTLQRRIKQWKAEHGEAKEVMFPQKYRPGHQAQSDFTFMGRLGVTIQGPAVSPSAVPLCVGLLELGSDHAVFQ